MINVIITRKDGSYSSFICSGHAEHGRGGFLRPERDVVCAGVSAIVINTINCLTDLLHEKIGCDMDRKNGGLITCVFYDTPTEKASFLIDSMIHGLNWIQKQYGKKYLQFEIREV